MPPRGAVAQPLGGARRRLNLIKIEALAGPQAVRHRTLVDMAAVLKYASGFEFLMATTQRLSVSVEAVAALGAELRLRQEELEGDR
jgi:hypothetical protein